MTAPAPGRTADNTRCGEEEVAQALALRDELMAYAAQLIRMSTQAGLGGRDISVRVKEPEHLAHPITRAASAIQARKWAAAEAEAASLRSQLQDAQKAGEAMRHPLGMSETPENAPLPALQFAAWSDADCAAQCQMQARENLDPELSAFWLEVSKRILAPKTAPLPETGSDTGGRREGA